MWCVRFTRQIPSSPDLSVGQHWMFRPCSHQPRALSPACMRRQTVQRRLACKSKLQITAKKPCISLLERRLADCQSMDLHHDPQLNLLEQILICNAGRLCRLLKKQVANFRTCLSMHWLLLKHKPLSVVPIPVRFLCPAVSCAQEKRGKDIRLSRGHLSGCYPKYSETITKTTGKKQFWHTSYCFKLYIVVAPCWNLGINP